MAKRDKKKGKSARINKIENNNKINTKIYEMENSNEISAETYEVETENDKEISNIVAIKEKSKDIEVIEPNEIENIQDDKENSKDNKNSKNSKLKTKDIKEPDKSKIIKKNKRSKRDIESKEKDNKKEKNLTFISTLIITFIILAGILIHKYDVIYKIKIAINPITITNISLEIEKNELEVGEEFEVKFKIIPENYTVSNLEWHSSDENIIEIRDGKITAKDIGKSTIYLVNDGIKSNELEVEVLVKLEDILVENSISELQKGNEYKLVTKPVPENATYSEVKFESDNSDILSVDNEGNLTAKELGMATINIKNYKDEVIKSLQIEVKKIPVEKIEIDDSQVTLGKGQSYILNAKVTPEKATYKDISWISSDTNIVTIENRKVKAINTGTATIKAVTDNGEKEAVCTIKVNNSNPKNTKRYANGNYNIRSGEGTEYEVLATTQNLEEIEFLKGYSNGWKKVRNSNGVVGYTLVKSNYYLSEKPVTNTDTSHIINNVPYINQFSNGYPTGCEAVSATMVLKYHGYNVSIQNIVNNTKNGSKKYQNEEGKWYGANPFEEFVGSPNMKLGEGAYGVFAKPIAAAMSIYAGGRVKNISGCSENQLFEYVKKDKPVVVWCVKNAGNLGQGVVWEYEDGSGSFQELVGEHCAVMIGYDENYVYLNDPSAGKKVKQNRAKFISNWKQLYSQAIVVE